jgi:hypothetical protein
MSPSRLATECRRPALPSSPAPRFSRRQTSPKLSCGRPSPRPSRRWPSSRLWHRVPLSRQWRRALSPRLRRSVRPRRRRAGRQNSRRWRASWVGSWASRGMRVSRPDQRRRAARHDQRPGVRSRHAGRAGIHRREFARGPDRSGTTGWNGPPGDGPSVHAPLRLRLVGAVPTWGDLGRRAVDHARRGRICVSVCRPACRGLVSMASTRKRICRLAGAGHGGEREGRLDAGTRRTGRAGGLAAGSAARQRGDTNRQRPAGEPAIGEPAIGEPATGEPAIGEPAIRQPDVAAASVAAALAQYLQSGERLDGGRRRDRLWLRGRERVADQRSRRLQRGSRAARLVSAVPAVVRDTVRAWQTVTADVGRVNLAQVSG